MRCLVAALLFSASALAYAPPRTLGGAAARVGRAVGGLASPRGLTVLSAGSNGLRTLPVPTASPSPVPGRTWLLLQVAKKRVLAVLGALAVILLPFSKAASAASTAVIKGFDLYGRMPYDDWLFSASRLVDPNLLKRSLVETIVAELPDVLGNFKKRKQLSEFGVIFSGLAYFFGGAIFISVLYKGALAAGLRRGAAAGKDDALGGGRGFSASAISKKGPRKGKQIEGMGDGWLDMEIDDSDDSPDAGGGGKGGGSGGDGDEDD